MKRFANLTIAAAIALSLPQIAAAGPIWPELNAGSLPGSAEIVMGVGTLKGIRGSLSSLLHGPGDFEDMYLIKISDPASFCAKTVVQPFDCCGNHLEIPRTTNFNTQLWIFKADATGILANDDDPLDPPRSRVGNAADDGSGAVITTAGLYYIAITGGPNNDPVSSTGPIFNQSLLTEVSGPDGPGGGGAITGWTGGEPTGNYMIVLCGASFVEAGDIPTASEWGWIVLASALVFGGAFIIRRRLHVRSAQ